MRYLWVAPVLALAACAPAHVEAPPAPPPAPMVAPAYVPPPAPVVEQPYTPPPGSLAYSHRHHRHYHKNVHYKNPPVVHHKRKHRPTSA